MSDFMQAGQITEAKQALERLRANMRLTIRGKGDVEFEFPDDQSAGMVTAPLRACLRR